MQQRNTNTPWPNRDNGTGRYKPSDLSWAPPFSVQNVSISKTDIPDDPATDWQRVKKRWHSFSASLYKVLICLLVAVCIYLSVDLVKLKDGLVHIPIDKFDTAFNSSMQWSDEAIWDPKRQQVIHGAVPVNVHSHNDYERRIPVFEALASGCISIEADIQFVDSDLLVGHSMRGLDANFNLSSAYLKPLERMIDAKQPQTMASNLSSLAPWSTAEPLSPWRGIFDRNPEQTIVLLVDFKTADDTFAELNRQLERLRQKDYLTYWNGTDRIMRPLTVVVSGDASFDSIMALNDSRRDIFFDAPITALASNQDVFPIFAQPVYKYNQSNSYYASGQWGDAILDSWPLGGHQRLADALISQSTDKERPWQVSQLVQASARGLLARYWDVPSGPQNLLDVIWRVLISKRAGIINMDDMATVRDRSFAWGEIVPVPDAVF